MDVRSVISCVEEFVAIVVTLLLVVVIGRLRDAGPVTELWKDSDDDSTGELDLGASEDAGPGSEALDEGLLDRVVPGGEELDGNPPEDVAFHAEDGADELGPLGEEPLEDGAPDDGEFELEELAGGPSEIVLLATGELGGVPPVIIMLDGRVLGDVEFHNPGLLGDGQPEEGRPADGASEDDGSVGLSLILVLHSQF